MRAIYDRVSIRKYEDRPVEEEKLMQILRAGMQAPSAGDQQPWEFYVVTNPDIIDNLAKTSPYAGCVVNAKTVIVPVYRKNDLMFPMYAQIDLAIAQENMWLETTELGLGGVWLGIAPQEERMEAVKKVLDLPDDVEAFSLYPIGYPAESKKQEDRFEESRIHYITK